ncbi:MAG: hypothetical protein JW720_15260 [Sedimentisphaerales bacterium]|nr:hypothetical protein [Sedimentisphaerales bacterium]
MDLQFAAIIIGDLPAEVAVSVVNILDGFGIESVRCEEVYSAVCRLREGGSGIVFGRLGELCREEGQFFEIAGRCGYFCCCYLDDRVASRQREVVSAMERGAFVFTEPSEVRELLGKLKGQSGSGGRRKTEKVIGKILGDDGSAYRGKGRSGGFLRDEFRMTKAETDALFGA